MRVTVSFVNGMKCESFLFFVLFFITLLHDDLSLLKVLAVYLCFSAIFNRIFQREMNNGMKCDKIVIFGVIICVFTSVAWFYPCCSSKRVYLSAVCNRTFQRTGKPTRLAFLYAAALDSCFVSSWCFFEQSTFGLSRTDMKVPFLTFFLFSKFFLGCFSVE